MGKKTRKRLSAIHFELLYQIPILKSNIHKCPICNNEFAGVSNVQYKVYYKGDSDIRFASARKCSKCKLFFMSQLQIDSLQSKDHRWKPAILNLNDYHSIDQLRTAVKTDPNNIDSNSSPRKHASIDYAEIENISELGKVISVYSQKCYCKKCSNSHFNSMIVNRTAKVQILSEELVNINVLYCTGCGDYFINYESLKAYQRMYGGILFECIFSEEFIPEKHGEFCFAPDTVLSRCGYSVREGISQNHRQQVLKYILDTNRATKNEVIRTINSFIAIRKNQPKYADACQRWREDILFVNNYLLHKQEIVTGLKFKQGGKISK